MAITIQMAQVPEGFVSLKEAAENVGLSQARARYYVNNGVLESWRDARNRIFVSEESIDEYLANPPQRVGRPKTAGTKKTYTYVPAAIGQLKGAIRQVRSHVADSAEKTTSLAVLSELLAWQIDVHEAGDDSEEDVEL